MPTKAVTPTVMNPPEAALLLACARIQPSAERQAIVERALSSDVDWERLLALAEMHGLLAMLFRGLQVKGLGPIPRAVEIRLWTYREQLRRKNRLMADELLAILALLEADSIPAVPYKGPVLAQRLYGASDCRECGDLDLLVKPKDLVRARELLATRGYAPLFLLTPALDRALLASSSHYQLALKHRVMVELHWKSDAEFTVGAFDEDDWWAQRPTIRFEGRDVLALQDRELVFALLVHGAKHLWEQVNWLAELAELLRQQSEFDWDWIRRKSEAMRARRRVAMGLLLLRAWFDTKLPDTIQDWVEADGRASSVAEAISRGWFGPGAGIGRPAFGRLSLKMKLYDSPGQAMRHAARVVFIPGLAEWVAWPLPRSLHAFYLPIRAARLLRKYLGFTRRA